MRTGKPIGRPRQSLEELSYGARHGRVVEAKGKAKNFPCIDCHGKACDWSQTHGTKGLDPEDYQPRCRSCHMKYDMTEKKRQTAAEVGYGNKGQKRPDVARRNRGNHYAKKCKTGCKCGKHYSKKCQTGCKCGKHTNYTRES